MKRIAIRLALALLPSTALAISQALAASASVTAPARWPCTASYCTSGDIYGYVEASPNLNVRTAPCVESYCGIAMRLPYGQQVVIDCYTRGDAVTGWGGRTDEWDLLLNTASAGDGYYGWASDAWINTGGDTATMVRECPS